MIDRKSLGILAVATLIALGAIGLAIVFASQKPQDATVAEISVVENRLADAVSASVVGGNQNQDPDEDGLLNWRETLWGTDPHNPDTDGDGVSDGEEVALGANPLKHGTELISENDTYEAPRGLAPTDALAREIFIGYANAKQDGEFSEEEISVAFADILARKIQEGTEVKKVYTLSDILIDPQLSIEEYERAFSSIIRKTTAVREYELNVFSRAVTDGQSSELTKLITSALIYETVRDELLTLNVPERVAREHLEAINTLSGLASATTNLSAWSGDPFDALALVNSFSNAEDDFSDGLLGLYSLVRAIEQQS